MATGEVEVVILRVDDAGMAEHEGVLATVLAEDWSEVERIGSQPGGCISLGADQRETVPEQLTIAEIEEVIPDWAIYQAQDLIGEFRDAFYPKYLRGQHEHGGNIMKMPGLVLCGHAMDEVLDQWSYIKGMQKAMEDAIAMLEESLTEDTAGAEALVEKAIKRLDG